MYLSVCIPFYNEAEQIELTLDTVEPIVRGITADYELVLIDDGSKDDTWKIIKKHAENDEHIHAIRFSRNFGKEAAISAALDAAQGQAVVMMDGDLQHPPKYIPKMVELWEQGYDVVEGVKVKRGKESRTYHTLAQGFNNTFHRMTGMNLDNSSDFKLLDRKVVEAFQEFGERNTFFRGLSSWLGFKHYELPFEVEAREFGHSKWSFSSLARLAVNAVTSFSTVPLAIIFFIGLLFLIISLIIGIVTLVKYFQGAAVEGFTTVILLQLISGGAILTCLGLLGTYIGKIYQEVKGRPRYIKMEEIDNEETKNQADETNPD